MRKGRNERGKEKRGDDEGVERKMVKEGQRGAGPRFFEARVSLGAVRESVVSPPMFYFILSAP